MAIFEAPDACSPRTHLPLAFTLVQPARSGLRCLACARRCLIHEGGTGFCTAVAHENGQLVSTAYGIVAEASVTPIESKPIYHFQPGARVLSLGGLGCNLRCRFCQNWELAFRDARRSGLAEPNLTPDAAVRLALTQDCAGLAWTFNEPSVSPMYVLDCARRARDAGLFTVFVTNGLITSEALALLGPWLDVYRVDLKSVWPEHYARFAATRRIRDVLSLTRRAQQTYGSHVEVVTNLMPGLNDSDEHLANLCGRVVGCLGADVPLHFTTYVPYAFMRDIPPTPPETLARARRLARAAGLRFVYSDSAIEPEAANTRCDGCGTLVVRRTKARTVPVGLAPDGCCMICGEPTGIVTRSSRRFSTNVL